KAILAAGRGQHEGDMTFDFGTHQGTTFAYAAALPLVAFVVAQAATLLWCMARPLADSKHWNWVYLMLGGDTPGMGSAFLSLTALGLSLVMALGGAAMYFLSVQAHYATQQKLEGEAAAARRSLPDATEEDRPVQEKKLLDAEYKLRMEEADWQRRWA